MMNGNPVCPSSNLVTSVQAWGNPVIDSVPSRPTAMPRYNASVPMVTASDGSPIRVTSRPFSRPPATPTSSTRTIASSNGTPREYSRPSTEQERPTIEPTEMSMSPVIMTSAIGNAMISVANMSRSRL